MIASMTLASKAKKLKFIGFGAVANINFADDYYLKTHAKIGRISSDYKSTFDAKELKYDIDRTYWGAGLEAGKNYEINPALNLDIHAGLSYLQIASANAKIAGENAKFNRVNSLKSKLGARADYSVSENFALFVGADYEYEFDGKAKGKIGNKKTTPPSLKGSTGTAQIGVKLSSGGFSSELSLKALAGKKQGANLGLNVKYEF